jgi:hypothetical protein
MKFAVNRTRSGICIAAFMVKELKKIPVSGQEEAFQLINRLSQHYDMHQDTQRHQFHVSNDLYSAYYDAEENVVKMESIHPETTEEQIKEFLMGFPTFF